MDTDSTLARKLWQFGEPVHAVTYFGPETRRRTDELGLKGGWMSYFGCRAAPMGRVSPAVVCAVFCNFHPQMVGRAIPDAWTFAAPSALLDARLQAVDQVLRRVLGDEVVGSGPVRRAAALARSAVEACPTTGRALGAANAALAAPDAAHTSLWQSLTTMRELRGDGHVAALAEAGIGPCEALVLQGLTGRSDPAALRANRGWSESEWEAATESLMARGWVDPQGAMTKVGRAARDHLEAATDRLAAPFVAAVGTESAAALVELLRPMADAVMAARAVPRVNNMGVPWPPEPAAATAGA